MYAAQSHDDDCPVLDRWTPLVAAFSSLHGVAWYNRISSERLRKLIFLGVMGITLGMPIVVAINILSFFTKTELSDSVIWSRAETIKYPNITLCHSGFFDLQRMEGDMLQTM